jgi:hypothetical protein
MSPTIAPTIAPGAGAASKDVKKESATARLLVRGGRSSTQQYRQSLEESRVSNESVF